MERRREGRRADRQPRKVLELSIGANSPDIAKLGDYVYTMFPLADVDITAWRRTPRPPGKKTAAVVYINNETGIDAAEVYKATFNAAGGGRAVRGL